MADRTKAAGLAVLAVAGLAVAACSQGAPKTTGTAASHPRVEMRFSPNQLGNALAVDDISVAERDELYVAGIQLRNPASHRRELQYRGVWRGSDGLPVGNPTTWRALRLSAGETHTIQLSSPMPEGERVTVQVREKPS